MRANKQADELLQQLNYPALPLDLDIVTKYLNCEIYYDNLHGIDGITFKKFYKNKWNYIMYIASEKDERYTAEQYINRQRYTIAHEIGHIVLHSHLDWNDVEGELSDVLEVEANWFASRLLMPDYAFTTISDLETSAVSQKCSVNFQAAQRRLRQLDRKIISNLIKKSTDNAYVIDLSKYEEIKSTEYDFDFEKAYQEIAFAYNIIPLVDPPDLFCYKCSKYTEDNRRNFILCDHCGNLLRDE